MNSKAINTAIITVLVGFICFSLPYPVLSPMFLNDTGILPGFSDHERTILLGIAMALYPIGQMIGGPFLGKYSDTHGRRPVLIISLSVAAVSCLLFALSVEMGNLPLLFFSRFLNGLCESNITVAQSIAADVSTEKDKTRNFSYITISINIGWIIGPLLGGKLADPGLSAWFDYSTPFYAAAILTVINLLLVIFMLPETVKKLKPDFPSAIEQKEDISFQRLLNNGALLKLYILSLASYFAIFLFFCYSACYYVKRFSLTPGELANYTAIISIPMIIAAYFVPWAEKHLPSWAVGFTGHILMAAGLIIFIIPGNDILTLIPLFLVGFGITSCELATSLAVSNSVDGSMQGRVLGLYRSVSVIAETLAALSGGVIAGLYCGYPFIVAALVSVPCGIYFLFNHPPVLSQNKKPHLSDTPHI